MDADPREHSSVRPIVLVPRTIAMQQQEFQLFAQLPVTGTESLMITRDKCLEGVTPLVEIDSTSVEWARSVFRIHHRHAATSDARGFRVGLVRTPRAFLRASLKGVTRALFGRRAPLSPQPKRASARRREEKDCMGVYMIQQVAAVHLGWGQAPSLDTKMTYESTIWVPLDPYCEY